MGIVLLWVCRAYWNVFLLIEVGIHGNISLWITSNKKKKYQSYRIILTLDLIALIYNDLLTIDNSKFNSTVDKDTIASEIRPVPNENISLVLLLTLCSHKYRLKGLDTFIIFGEDFSWTIFVFFQLIGSYNFSLLNR